MATGIFNLSSTLFGIGINIQKYDFVENNWIVFKSIPIGNRKQFGAVFLSGELLIMGGCISGAGQGFVTYNNDVCMNTVSAQIYWNFTETFTIFLQPKDGIIQFERFEEIQIAPYAE